MYTSGKGSSAAGLTASVIRDANTGEFYLEVGGLILRLLAMCHGTYEAVSCDEYVQRHL